MGWGSEIQKKPIPDPDPWVKKASDPEPRIRITAFILGYLGNSFISFVTSLLQPWGQGTEPLR